MKDWFESPRRLSKNCPGSFYTTGWLDNEGFECGDCLACGLPEEEAPSLLADLDDTDGKTYFVRQPQTESEVEDVCCAIEVCCNGALRYGGKDIDIIIRLGNHSGVCDYVVTEDGCVQLSVNPKTGEG